MIYNDIEGESSPKFGVNCLGYNQKTFAIVRLSNGEGNIGAMQCVQLDASHIAGGNPAWKGINHSTIQCH